MNAQASSFERSSPSTSMSVIAWAAAFWLFTYALLSVRAELLSSQAAGLSPQRFVGTVVGAFCFGLVLHWIRRAEHRIGGSRAAAVLATILPASLFVLAARLGADVLFAGQVRDFSNDLRWILVWAGYFGLWISAAMAVQNQPARVRHRKFPPTFAPSAVPPLEARPRPQAGLVGAWEGLIEMAAQEMAALPAQHREELVQRLTERAGYELADDIASSSAHNARVQLTWRIVFRMRQLKP